MVTGWVVLTTTMLIQLHKEPTQLPATAASKQTPPGEDQCGTHGHPIHAGPGGKHQTHMHKVWYTDLLQGKQDSQTTSSSAQGQGPKGK